MATDHDAFLAAIHVDPDDLTARLVYADWLDEQGDPRGELVRLICEERVNSHGKGSAWKRLERLGGGLAGIATRLDEGQRRNLALDFAEHVLPLFAAQYPRDKRLEEAVQASREFARELIAATPGRRVRSQHDLPLAAAWVDEVLQELQLGANDPADGAARYAARAASAAIAEQFRPNETAKVASYAEWAAYDTALAQGQSGEAARDAEKSWQLCRAVEYLLGFVPPQAISVAD